MENSVDSSDFGGFFARYNPDGARTIYGIRADE